MKNKIITTIPLSPIPVGVTDEIVNKLIKLKEEYLNQNEKVKIHRKSDNSLILGLLIECKTYYAIYIDTEIPIKFKIRKDNGEIETIRFDDIYFEKLN